MKVFRSCGLMIAAAMLLLGSTVAYAQQTPGQIVKFGPGSPPPLEDSNITEDPIFGNVGIGTTSPTGRLHIGGPTPEVFLVGNTTANQDGLRVHYNEQIRWGVIDVKGNALALRGESDAMGEGATSRLLIDLTNGNVGIGTTSPGTKLDVVGTDTFGIRYLKSGPDARITVGDSTKSWSAAVGWALGRPGDFSILEEGVGERLHISQGGNVGIGTTTPVARLNVEAGGGLFEKDALVLKVLDPNRSTIEAGWGSPTVFNHTFSVSGSGQVQASGRVRAIGGFNGDCYTTPTPVAVFTPVKCNQDVAETFASLEATEPGDLVVLVNQSASMPTVRKSTRPYEALLVGAVSTNPGLVFDNGETHLAGDNSKLITPEKTVVGLVGRVPVKVSLENGPIAVGDPLTSSSTPGVAMKATRASQIIGYAMEKADQKGKVLVHLQPGYYIPPKQLAQLSEMDELKAQVSKLEGLLKTVLAQRSEKSAMDEARRQGYEEVHLIKAGEGNQKPQ